jgi:hypothetical protein
MPGIVDTEVPLQTIIDTAASIEFDRRRIVATSISRSQRIKTAERPTAQPWTFKITPAGAFRYNENRSILEKLYLQERVEEYEVNLANNPRLSYITNYRGDLTSEQLTGLRTTATSTTTITVDLLPAVNPYSVIFKRGDFIQPDNSRYPYTVVQDVLRGQLTTVTLNLNRPIITSENITLTNQKLRVGTDTTLKLLVVDLPSYNLVPGGLVQFSGDFRVVERVV